MFQNQAFFLDQWDKLLFLTFMHQLSLFLISLCNLFFFDGFSLGMISIKPIIFLFFGIGFLDDDEGIIFSKIDLHIFDLKLFLHGLAFYFLLQLYLYFFLGSLKLVGGKGELLRQWWVLREGRDEEGRFVGVIEGVGVGREGGRMIVFVDISGGRVADFQFQGLPGLCRALH